MRGSLSTLYMSATIATCEGQACAVAEVKLRSGQTHNLTITTNITKGWHGTCKRDAKRTRQHKISIGNFRIILIATTVSVCDVDLII